MTDYSLAFQAETQLPTEFGSFRFRVYKNYSTGVEAIAIATRGIEQQQNVPVRIHSACFTAEVMSSLKCDCKQQLDYALGYIAEHGGIVIYLHQEGRGIGLSNKIRAYALQEDGHDTIEANRLLDLPVDSRRYDDAAFILRDLKIDSIRLITNNPDKLHAMRGFGFSIESRIPVPTIANLYSHGYLETKRSRMGHLFSAPIFNGHDSARKHAGTLHRPFVHINFAIDQRGRMNQQNGRAINLSCGKDWQRVHELRERYSAVVVGAKTWALDQPQLTARQDRLGRVPRQQPDRVVFAGRTPCPIKPDSRRSFVVGLTHHASNDCIHIKATGRKLKKPLETLLNHGLDTLLVEGGMTLLKSFIDQKLFDRLTIYVGADSPEKAIHALRYKFPELPTAYIDTVPLGKGMLLSYSPSNVSPGSVGEIVSPCFSQAAEAKAV